MSDKPKPGPDGQEELDDIVRYGPRTRTRLQRWRLEQENGPYFIQHTGIHRPRPDEEADRLQDIRLNAKPDWQKVDDTPDYERKARKREIQRRAMKLKDKDKEKE